ncbi:hypothetical protein TrVE_jg6238 [Triparma verrucosa]|uniref:Uncharacterized protein n=1 Tax=Triparma verrucosa TaxID=1606542 RepID=A0A9W7C2G3_9STRA|nr:hypothetical protein TrVE_jg6238 [Triparma verrucosa]
MSSANNTLRSKRAILQKDVAATKKAGGTPPPDKLQDLKNQSKQIAQHDKQLNAIKVDLVTLTAKVPNVVDEMSLSLSLCSPAPDPKPASSHLPLATQLITHPDDSVHSYVTTYMNQINGFSLAPSDPPLLRQQKNSWVAEKTLPCRFCTTTPQSKPNPDPNSLNTTLVLLSLTANNLGESRKEYHRTIDLLLTLLSSLSMKGRALPFPPADMDMYAVAEADLEVFSPSSNKYVKVGRVSNFTDFYSREFEVRAGVKKMIQINKNYCHSIHSFLDLTEAKNISSAKNICSSPPPPLALVLHELDKFFLVNSYVSKSYKPNDDDVALRKELSEAGLHSDDYMKWTNLRRWGNAVAEIR